MSFVGPRFDYHIVGSTLDTARDMARWGAPHGTMVTAAHQTRGRGRRGATWRDEPGESALMSFIARPDGWAPVDFWRAGLLASLACVRLLHARGYDEAQVKWPNDLTIRGEKLGGILVETLSDGGRACLLIGVGINVGQTSFADVAGDTLKPTSLYLAAKRTSLVGPPNATEVATGVAEELDCVWSAFASEPDLSASAWRRFQMTGHLQRGVRLDTGDKAAGVYTDIRATDGAGLLRCDEEPDLVAVAPAV